MTTSPDEPKKQGLLMGLVSLAVAGYLIYLCVSLLFI